MKYDPEKHQRRSIRLRGYDYSQPGAYFITMCTRDRECMFGDVVDGHMELNEYGKIAMHRWLEIPMHYPNVSLDECIIMPDHIHAIIIINDVTNGSIIPLVPYGQFMNCPDNEHKKQRRKMTIPKIIGRFKMNTAKQINQLRQTPGTPVWQRNYYEHIIRDEHALHRIRRYIAHNPAKWRNDNNYF